MAKCVNCGRELEGNERFCPNCGSPIGNGNSSNDIAELTQAIKLLVFENRTQNEKIIKLLDNQNKMICELGKMVATISKYQIVNTIFKD
ncbi:zinc-ribbon domain-containing protein [Butyrivibrio sp. AE3004]|uniref:zinc-ribbon domain-containing protein n=1 Tax=Butyrivibrio sp. AE3004 TaxID=1506994 RepID=UPI000493BDB1|nr:zinc ribbon domain-containing protein [Butyrivibrio sp. AE3004]